MSCDREGEATPTGRRLPPAAVLICLAVAGSACASGDARDASGSYDRYTQQLIQLQADQNGDGRLDQWTYVDGNRLIRGEADTDGDGRIDRWEYFDGQSALTRVGTSSLNDGIEDTWTWTAAADGEGRIDRARQRDRHIDRREYYRAAVLIHTEEDSNGDGLPDRWDRYEGTVLRQAAFDTTLTAGRPNRRVVYDAGGRFLQVEADPELDGSFVTMSGAVPADIPGGIRR
jgi:hypothetical protein